MTVQEPDATAPLSGILVADFGQVVAGAAIGQALAQLGADVIKIEPVGGEPGRGGGAGGRPFIREFNRGKRSLAIDLRDERGLDAVRALLRKADVLIVNMRPGAMERLGLGYSEVRALNPRIVYASVTGFGSEGPSRGRPGLDTSAQAESGLMSITGTAGGPPERVGTSVIDVAAAHFTTQAILAALFRRERTGQGDVIDNSLLASAIALQSVAWCEYFQTGLVPQRGAPKTVPPPAADVIRTLDGEIVLTAHQQEHWIRLCRTMDRTDLLQDERFANGDARLAHRDELLEIVNKELGGRSTDEVMKMLVENSIVAGQILNYDEVRSSPTAQELGIFGRAEGAGEDSYEALNLPYRLGSWAAPTLPVVDKVGGHSREILREIGYSEEAVELLVSGGVVGAPPDGRATDL